MSKDIHCRKVLLQLFPKKERKNNHAKKVEIILKYNQKISVKMSIQYDEQKDRKHD